jgi:hypothetical protein
MTQPRLRRWWWCAVLTCALSGMLSLAECTGTVPTTGHGHKPPKSRGGRHQGTAQGSAEFPWPPPAPSAFYKLPRSLFGSAENFGQVADRIELALGQAGYTEIKFYSIKNDGFAMVTRIESIRADGTCREEKERWLVNSPPMFSLSDFLDALLRARRGLYRVWAFAVTSLDAAFAAPPTETEIKLLFSRGRIRLPVEVRKLPLSGEHQFLALIYEFERRDVPPPVLNAPSTLTGAQHLAAATIMRGLER